MIGLVAIGFAGGFMVHQTMVQKMIENRVLHGPRVPLDDRMVRMLDLTDDQLVKLRPVLKEHHQRMREMDKGLREHRHELFESLHHALEEELTESQKEKMSGFLERQERFRGHLREGEHRKGERKRRFEKGN